MQSQKLTPAEEPTSTELDSFSISDYVGLILAGLILLALLALLWHLQGPKELSSFLGNSASGWAQAIGAVGAIFASYKMGESSFKRQLIRDEIAQLESRRHSFDVLYEVFGTASDADGLCSCISAAPQITKAAKALAIDALQQLSSIHALSVPQPAQVRQLNLCRQAMITYIRMATSWEEKEDPQILQRWSVYALDATRNSNVAMDNCKFRSEKLEEEILQLKKRLHG